jgi:hypothetical protein
MRLRHIPAGTRAIKRVVLPRVNVPGPALPDQPELAQQRDSDRAALDPNAPPDSPPGASVISEPEVGLRVLTGGESAMVIQKAGEYARANGGTGALDDPLYGLGIQAYTLALACVDPDTDPKNPDPFFGEVGDLTLESAAQEILSTPHLGRDGIVFLYEAQELWQDMCSPQAHKIGAQEFMRVIGETVATGDPRGFLALRPGTRFSCFHSMAQLYLSSQMDKSGTGSSSPESKSSTEASES